ncbi:putative thymidylate synthase B [Trichinella spiralis]|uniref:putative thymidylate synthase B n=1 Tax=Trichinella spiralis TaxID=6334 RepID=UPI0001EFBDFB|nr:putative thymidylate synthase B [Trichinella spiralis]
MRLRENLPPHWRNGFSLPKQWHRTNTLEYFETCQSILQSVEHQRRPGPGLVQPFGYEVKQFNRNGGFTKPTTRTVRFDASTILHTNWCTVWKRSSTAHPIQQTQLLKFPLPMKRHNSNSF